MNTSERRLPFVLLIVFILMVWVGLANGEVAAVLNKATRICLSCMGIG